MKVTAQFMPTLLLMLMMASASHGWHGKRRVCPEQLLPVGGDCKRYREDCQAHTVCERSDHTRTYACKISFGNDCTESEQCVEGAFCIQNECRIPAGNSGCGSDNYKCVTYAICESDVCRIPAGTSGCGSDSNKCVTSAVCESDVCRLPIGTSGCGIDSSKCVTSAICESDICKIPYASSCAGNEQHCQNQGVCDFGLCGCVPLPNNAEGFITSSNYPNDHDHDEDELWTITAPVGQVIRVDFIFFAIEMDTYCTVDDNPLDSDCSFDYIRLDDGISPSGRICGTGCPNSYWSQSNQVALRFITDDVYRCRGFKLAYYFTVPQND